MTATNHFLTGAVIGAAVANPFVALLMAVASHFALDVMPHYDMGGGPKNKRAFLRALIIDGAIVAIIAASLLLAGWPSVLWLIATGIVAASPDALWIPYAMADIKGRPKPFGPYSRWAKKIQWCERPWGLYVEFVWGLGMVWILTKLFDASL